MKSSSPGLTDVGRYLGTGAEGLEVCVEEGGQPVFVQNKHLITMIMPDIRADRIRVIVTKSRALEG